MSSPLAIAAVTAAFKDLLNDGFLNHDLSSAEIEGVIRIEVRRRGGTVSVEWPASAGHECALLLRELMR